MIVPELANSEKLALRLEPGNHHLSLKGYYTQNRVATEASQDNSKNPHLDEEERASFAKRMQRMRDDLRKNSGHGLNPSSQSNRSSNRNIPSFRNSENPRDSGKNAQVDNSSSVKNLAPNTASISNLN